jgi:hypothetical protein
MVFTHGIGFRFCNIINCIGVGWHWFPRFKEAATSTVTKKNNLHIERFLFIRNKGGGVHWGTGIEDASFCS